MSSTRAACWATCATLALAASAAASDHAAPAEQGAADAAGADVSPQRTDILDLGAFRVRTTRARDGEVVDVKFALYLVLSSDSDQRDFDRLFHWRRRLRDQVIIAVRSAAPEDFAEPDLRRLHRLILFRVKRLAVAANVIGVYLIDFAVDEGEDVSAQYEPLIIPPAAAPKKPAEGGH